MCAASDLASCRWNFRSVYTSVLAYLGGKAVERSGRTNLQSWSYYNHWWGLRLSPTALSLPPLHHALILFTVVLSAPPPSPPPSSKATGSCRCYDKVTYPVSQADVHSAPFHQHFVIQWEQTLWEQIGATQKTEHKKSCREPDRFMCSRRREWGGEGSKERDPQSKILWGFFFWFIQRLLCVGYSKSSIHPHPGGKSSELQAWVVLHLTAAIQ